MGLCVSESKMQWILKLTGVISKDPQLLLVSFRERIRPGNSPIPAVSNTEFRI